MVLDVRQQRIREGTVPWPKLAQVSPSATPLLVGIDPYGKTAFNGMQCRFQLLDEALLIRKLYSQEADVIAAIDELTVLINEVLARPHRMLWFWGD